MLNLSLRQLRAFAAVAELASFTKAAQKLHLSQAALSAIVRELEDQLGCRLFDRTTRAVAMTEAGRLFHPAALATLETLETAAQTLGQIGREATQTLRVGFTPTMASSMMPVALARFVAAHPEVSIEISDARPDELLRMVDAGDIDAAFGAFFSKASGVERRPLFPTRLLLVSAAHPVPGATATPAPDQLSWRRLDGSSLICLPPDNPVQQLVDEALVRERVVPAKRTTVSHMETAIALAEAGFGVAAVPSFTEATCQRFAVRLDPLHPTVDFFYYCITRTGRGPIELVERFSEVFVNVAHDFDNNEAG